MPFVTVNCGVITPSLIGSELFGICAKSATHVDEKEGYFEQAEGGTIFLDEIGTMPSDQQTSLLRVLQDKKISRVGSKKNCNCKNKKHPDHTAIQLDVRVIAATNEEIPMAIKERRFRQDLFRRLKAFTIEMPPLRERKEDIEILYRYFINKLKFRLGKTNMIDTLRPDVKEMLENYHWPENIGELESAIERAMIITNSAILLGEDFSLEGNNRNKEMLYDSSEIIDRCMKEEEFGFEKIKKIVPIKTPAMKAILEGICQRVYKGKGALTEDLLVPILKQNTRANVHRILEDHEISTTELKKQYKKKK